MTKREVVAALRRKFNNWCALLPDDVEFNSCNDSSEEHENNRGVGTLHVLELAAEEAE